MCAARGGNARIVAAALADPIAKKAIDDKNDDGDTALMLAAERGHLEVVRALLDAKANVKQQTTTMKPRL